MRQREEPQCGRVLSSSFNKALPVGSLLERSFHFFHGQMATLALNNPHWKAFSPDRKTWALRRTFLNAASDLMSPN